MKIRKTKKVKANLVVGVVDANNLADFIFDEIDAGIDINYEYSRKVYQEQLRLSDEIPEEDYEARLQEWDENYSDDNRKVLFGDWTKIESKGGVGFNYIPKKNGKHGFSATCSTDNGCIVCVESSNYHAKCRKTSPCYVMRDGRPCGDLDSEGDDVDAYCLPPDYFEKEE